jgi:kynurenine formamidase
MKVLSYCLNDKLKFYGGRGIFLPRNVIDSKEKYVRETILDVDSHTGTHIDYPAHVFKNGKFGEDYPIDHLISNKCCIAFVKEIIDMECPFITYNDIKKFISSECELLLVNTGFSLKRYSDEYWQRSPVISSQLPLEIKKNHPSVRAVCFDVISVTSQLNKNEGRECHRNFLSDEGGDAVLIIEDADFSNLEKNEVINEISIVPFVFEKMDGALCIIYAKTK